MYRGLLSAKMITREDIPVLERRLLEVDRYTELNKMFTINRGHRFIDKMRAFGKWLYTHREEIFRILGIVVMLMDDGTEKLMTVEDAEKLEASRKPKPKRKRKPKKAQPLEETPDGEKVYDYVTPAVAARSRYLKKSSLVKKNWVIAALAPLSCLLFSTSISKSAFGA